MDYNVYLAVGSLCVVFGPLCFYFGPPGYVLGGFVQLVGVVSLFIVNKRMHHGPRDK